MNTLVKGAKSTAFGKKNTTRAAVLLNSEKDIPAFLTVRKIL